MATIFAPRPLTAERWFYLGIAGAILLVIFAGFAPSFYMRGIMAARAPLLPITPLVMLHGLLFTSWVLLFATQVSLISAGQRELHKKLGMIGFGLTVAMPIVGAWAALNGVARHSGPPAFAPLVWLAIPLIDVPVFATLIAAGLYNRRVPQTHKRLMLIATIAMLMPAMGRLPRPEWLIFPVVILLTYGISLGALVAWDIRSQGRIHRATLWGGSFVIASWIFRLAIMQTPAWISFAGWAQSFVA
jgi:hypothetical protein